MHPERLSGAAFSNRLADVGDARLSRKNAYFLSGLAMAVVAVAVAMGCSSEQSGSQDRPVQAVRTIGQAETPVPSPEQSVQATSPPLSSATPSSKSDPTPRPSVLPTQPSSATPSLKPDPTARSSALLTPSPSATPSPKPDPTPEREYEIVTLLPFDAIPAISNPILMSAEEAEELYDSDELVLGVEIDDDARAYSVPLLSRHEIVNDVVGGKPVAVTW